MFKFKFRAKGIQKYRLYFFPLRKRNFKTKNVFYYYKKVSFHWFSSMKISYDWQTANCKFDIYDIMVLEETSFSSLKDNLSRDWFLEEINNWIIWMMIVCIKIWPKCKMNDFSIPDSNIEFPFNRTLSKILAFEIFIFSSYFAST